MTNSTTIHATSVAGACPTVRSVDVASHLRTRINDTDSSDYEFSNTDLTTILERVMDEYTRLAPYYKEWTLTTVTDTADYAVPTDCIHLVEVEWRPWPSLTTNTFVGFWNALYGSADILPHKDWADQVLNKFREELAVRYDNLGAGTHSQITYTTSYSPTAYVRLFPTPTDSTSTVTCKFTCKHPLQSNDYFTVPASHVLYVEKLMEAEVCDMRALKFESSADTTRVGTTDFRFTSGPIQLRKRAGMLRQEVYDALSRPVIVHG